MKLSILFLALLAIGLSACNDNAPNPAQSSSAPLTQVGTDELVSDLIQMSPARAEEIALRIAQAQTNESAAELSAILDSRLTIQCDDLCTIQPKNEMGNL